MKVSHIANAIDELFHPVRETNAECTPRLLEIVKVGMTRLRDEMLDPKKATYYNLSVSKEPTSWEYCSDRDKIDSRGCIPNNDLAESMIGGVGRNIEIGGMVGIHRAAGQSDMKRSGYLRRGLPVQRKRKRESTGSRADGKGFFQYHERVAEMRIPCWNA